MKVTIYIFIFILNFLNFSCESEVESFAGSRTFFYDVTPTGDTLNYIDTKGLRQGKWVLYDTSIHEKKSYPDTVFYKDGKLNSD